MRALLIDDERRARERLRHLLATGHPGIEIVGEAENGVTGLDRIAELTPDVVFLDVQMPGMDGFEMLENLPEAGRPAIVFATAFDQYALKAFEANAVDYLLKPIEQDRLAKALAKVLERRPDGVGKLLASRPPLKRIAGKRLQRIHVLGVDAIEAFICEDELVFAMNREGRFLVNLTLRELEAKLDPEQFARIHKSTIVNLSAVSEIDADSRSTGSVRLASGATLEMSRRYAAKVKELLGL